MENRTRSQRTRARLGAWAPWIVALFILVIVITCVVLLALLEEPCESIETHEEAYKCSSSVAVLMVRTDQGLLVPDYNDCLLSNWPRACHEERIPLIDGHRWHPRGGVYQCLETQYKSARVIGLEPNLYDFVIEDSFDPTKCRWQCDPETEENCQE